MTNLPELPEGFYWSVSHPHYYTIFGDLSGNPNPTKLQVSLCRDLTETKVYRVNRGKNALTNWFFSGETIKVSETVDLTRTLYTRECKGVHAQAVVNAANVILKEWTKQKETAKLLGNYPPKVWDYSKEETA